MAQYGTQASTFRPQRNSTGMANGSYRSAPPIYETDPDTGNLRASGSASAQQARVATSASPAAAPSSTPLSNVYASVPRPQGTNIGGTIAGKLAEKGLEKGAGMVWDYAKSKFRDSDPSGMRQGGLDGASSDIPDRVGSDWATGNAPDASGMSGAGLDGAAGDAISGGSTSGLGDGGFSGAGYDGAAGDVADSVGSDWANGNVFNAVDADGNLISSGAFDGAGDFVPYAGSILQAAQGNWGGAAGSAIGTAVGNAIFPVVGGFIGGAIGGALGGGCFITQSTMAALGSQDDNAPELQTLRWFRDNIMLQDPRGRQMVEQYYRDAPDIATAISLHPDAQDIFRGIFTQFIQPAVQAIEAKQYKQALQIYAQMINAVEPYAAEMAQMDQMGGEYNFEGADQLGSDAAMQSYAPADDMAPSEFNHPQSETWAEDDLAAQMDPDAQAGLFKVYAR